MPFPRRRHRKTYAFRLITIAAGTIFTLSACSSDPDSVSPVARSEPTSAPSTTHPSATTKPTPLTPPPSDEPFPTVLEPGYAESSAPAPREAPSYVAEKTRRPIDEPETALPLEAFPSWTPPAATLAPPTQMNPNQALPPEYGVKNVQLGTTCVKGSTGSEQSGLIAYCAPVQPGRDDAGYMWVGQ